MKDNLQHALVFIGVLLLIVGASNLFAAHSFHSWREISRGVDDRGRTVCTWECRAMGETHHAVTRSYGNYCQRPR